MFCRNSPGSSSMSSGVCRRVLQRLQTAGSAPTASLGSWSRIPSSCCRLRAGPGYEARRGLSVPGRSTMNVFNREMKKRQKNWAASVQDGHLYDYLRDEVWAHVPQFLYFSTQLEVLVLYSSLQLFPLLHYSYLTVSVTLQMKFPTHKPYGEVYTSCAV